MIRQEIDIALFFDGIMKKVNDIYVMHLLLQVLYGLQKWMFKPCLPSTVNAVNVKKSSLNIQRFVSELYFIN